MERDYIIVDVAAIMVRITQIYQITTRTKNTENLIKAKEDAQIANKLDCHNCAKKSAAVPGTSTIAEV